MRTKNVQEKLDLEDVFAIPPRFVKRDDQYLQYGDVLISSANSWNLVGKCSWVGDLPWKSTFGGFVTVMRTSSVDLEESFLYSWFSSRRIQEILRSFGNRTTSISNLDLNRCRRMNIPLPPIEMQREFTRASRSVFECSRSLEDASESLTCLFSSLQQKAFQGAL